MEQGNDKLAKDGPSVRPDGKASGPGPVTEASEVPPSLDPTVEQPGTVASEDRADPAEVVTPEQQARLESEVRLKGLLRAYQETREAVEGLPAVVWVPWGQGVIGRHLKVPYLRWFLAYFVAHHIGRSLDALNRRFHAIDAVSGDHEANKSNREVIKLYMQSLPSPPYRTLIFAAVIAALVIALPLQSFGNVFYVLDLVGATLRFDVGYVGRAFARKDLGPTLRSLFVLLVGLVTVAAVLTSPFGLKRMLFNLFPWSSERLDSTAARSHAYRVEGLYELEDSVFRAVGIRRPKEGRWDLAFQTFLLSLLLLFGLCLVGLNLVVLLAWNINLNLDTGGSANVNFTLPQVSWVYYALFTAVVLAAFVLLLMRLVAAWKKRSRKATG